ncbi:MAG TPA: flagellar hook-associated protein FlgK [Gemmatimonadaceae bacterium]|nr:flagellar hook-associated protein FlgK [Gemmatimonadaceae bacterium]
MSINSIFNTATLAIQAQQTAIDTAAHNIANAGVAGYSRQVVNLQPNTPLYTPTGAIGTGVLVQDISRVRDTMLDTNYRAQASQAAGYSTAGDILTSIGQVFGEPSSTGLSSTLDQFYASWGDLANNPTSSAAKSVVQERGSQVATMLNQFSTNLDQLSSNTMADATQQVSSINQYTAQIANINKQIVAAEADGKTTANDLRDMRDNAIDALSKIVPVRVIDQPNGSDTVYVAGATVVDGSTSSTFSLQQSSGKVALQLNGRTFSTQSPGGALGADLDGLNTDIPNAKSQLDTLAAGVVTSVNAIHTTGWTAAGDAAGGSNWNASAPPTGSNINFFDPTRTTAATISLSAQVASNASYIAAGDAQGATGNNNVANAMAALGSDMTTMTKFGSSTETTSISEFYRDLVTRVGVATSDATSSATVYQTLTQQADTQRQSVSGVSTDEELISLTKSQQAYAAAAKVITTAASMSQTLLDMIQ